MYSCNFIRSIYLQFMRNMVLLLLSSHIHTSIAYDISLIGYVVITLSLSMGRRAGHGLAMA